MKQRILIDSTPEHRGFFSTINLTLLTLLYCKKNNIHPIIGDSVLMLYGSRFRRKRPFSEFFGTAYDDTPSKSAEVLDIAWAHNNELLLFETTDVIKELRVINNELLLCITQELKDFIEPPPRLSNFSFNISVHYRGCDYLKNTPVNHQPNLQPKSFIECVHKVLHNQKMFVATDDDSFINLLIDMEFDIAYFSDVYRKGPGRGSHIRTRWQRLGLPSLTSQKRKGFEVFRDCFWLSRSNLYIGSNSNLMYYSSLLNPLQNSLNITALRLKCE